MNLSLMLNSFAVGSIQGSVQKKKVCKMILSLSCLVTLKKNKIKECMSLVHIQRRGGIAEGLRVKRKKKNTASFFKEKLGKKISKLTVRKWLRLFSGWAGFFFTAR